jgi:hypothetical protein
VYYVEQSASFEAIIETGQTGLAGTIELEIQDNQGNVVSAASSAAIIESPAGSGAYQATRTAPASVGQYSLVWSEDGSFDADHTTLDDLTVVEAGATNALPPVTPITPGPGAVSGPCNVWTESADVATCCGVSVGSDVSLFDDVALAASQVLYQLSIRQFPGTCDRTVRPCRTSTPCGFQVLSRGHIVDSPYDSWAWTGSTWGQVSCGCQPLSQVELAGYPVREIIEVKIDGDVLADTEYLLDAWRYLVRKNGEVWPACQRLDLDDTEDGTWSVRYTFGQDPPMLGQMAARELACELYKACQGSADCVMPSGVTRVVRQNITIERNAFTAWGRQGGIWRTGLPQVDLFLNTYNPAGIQRRPVMMTPGRRVYPVGR